MSYPASVYPPSVEAGSVTTGSDGTATITFRTPRPYKPRVVLSCDADDCVAMVIQWLTSGGLYTGCRVKAYGVLNSRSLSTASAVTSVSTSTETVVGDVTHTTTSVVSGIPSATGDADGRYTVDGSGYLHHDHAIGSPSTTSVVSGITKTTKTVVSGVSTSTASVVTGVTLSLVAKQNVGVMYLVV